MNAIEKCIATLFNIPDGRYNQLCAEARAELTTLRTQAAMLGVVVEALAQCTEDMIDRRIPVRKYTKVLTAARAVLENRNYADDLKTIHSQLKFKEPPHD